MKYETTHPWLRFKIDFQDAGAVLWMNLGEAKSKCEHIAGVPLTPITAAELHKIYLTKGVLATAAIEGNTLTEDQVRRHLEGKLSLPKSQEYLKQEIDNIREACQIIGQNLLDGRDRGLTPDTIRGFNKLVLRDLEHGEDTVPGEFSEKKMGVGSYGAPDPDEYPALVEKLCVWLNSSDFIPAAGQEIPTAILKAVVAHLYFVWIHPFGDGNGRTARLIEYQILASAGVPSPAAHLLSNHYNQTRMEYYRQLDRASKSGGDIIPFARYAIQGLVDGLREQLKWIRFQQWSVAWVNFVHDKFRGPNTPAEQRQRELVLALPLSETPVSKIPELNVSLAREYAKKTTRTIQRDVNDLIDMGLIERNGQSIRPKRESILAFLPAMVERYAPTQLEMGL